MEPKKSCYIKRRGSIGRGYVGQFVLNTQVGDLVFLPLDSTVPFPIHPRPEEKTYKLIRKCYVHGIIEREAFEEANNSLSDIHLIDVHTEST